MRPDTREAVELVLRRHLPVPLRDATAVLCLCDVRQDYEGPVGHRLHVADELQKAGLLRDRSQQVPGNDGGVS